VDAVVDAFGTIWVAPNAVLQPFFINEHVRVDVGLVKAH